MPSAEASAIQKPDRYKWLPVLVMVLTVAAGGVILLGVWKLADNLMERTGRDLQWIAMEIADKLDLLLSDRYGDVQIIGNLLPEIGDETERFKWTQQLKNLQEAYPIYAWIGLLDESGGIVAATDPDTIGRNAGSMNRLSPLDGKPAVMVHGFQHDDLLKDQHTIGFSIPVTIHASAGSFSFHGYVMTRITIAALNSIVTRTLRASNVWTNFRRDLEYQIIDKQGGIIIDSLHHPQHEPNLLSQGVESVKLTTQGKAGYVIEPHARRSVEVLTGFAPMPPREELKNLAWGILVRLDSSTVLQPIHEAVQTAMSWAVCVLLPIWGFLVWTLYQLRTEWRQTAAAKQALQEAGQLLQTILDDALDAHIMVDQKGNIMKWNPKAETIFRWSAEEAIGQRLVDLTRSSYHQQGTEQDLLTVLEAELGRMLQQRAEFNCRDKDGRSFPVELSLTTVKTPNGFLYSIFARDITDQKQEQRYRTVEHQIPGLLLEAPSFEAVNECIMRSICEVLGWRLSILWKVDEEAGVLRYVKHWKLTQEQLESFLERKRQMNFAIGNGLPGKAWKSGKVEWISDVTHDNNFPETVLAKKAGLHAAFAFPIKLESKVQAVMEFFSDAIQPPDQKVMDLFDNIARQLSSS